MIPAAFGSVQFSYSASRCPTFLVTILSLIVSSWSVSVYQLKNHLREDSWLLYTQASTQASFQPKPR